VLVLDDDDTVKFNGYVERQTSLTREKRKFVCKGNEQRLACRYLPKIPLMGHYFWTQLYYILTDRLDYAMSDLGPFHPGALWCANSFWPPGTRYWVYDSSKNIIKLSYEDHHIDATGKLFYILKDEDVTRLENYPNLSDLQIYEGVHIDSIKISIFVSPIQIGMQWAPYL